MIKALAIAVVLTPAAFGQVVVYEENFPYPGGAGSFSVSVCGWSNAVPNNPNRLFQNSGADGAVYAYQANADVPVSTAFFTTATLDNGRTGMAFPIFNPTAFSGLTFSVDIRPNFDPDNVVARFAVQMNGAHWYAATATLPVPTSTGGFATYTQAFAPVASGWNALTMTATDATLGAAAASDLMGNITGVGMVFTHTVDNGTHDFDRFRITAMMGSIAVTAISESTMSLGWFGSPDTRLLSATNLTASAWQDVPGTLGQSVATVPLSSTQMFFRLATPTASGGVSSNLANLSFEADGAPVTTPLGWTTTGNAAADAVVSGDAYTGSFSLQHSNAAAYQVQTSMVFTNLTNGYYRLNARVKNSGGQKACYIAGNDKLTSLPPLYTNWTETVVRGINVTNGQCEIRIYSDASASNWCRVDAITLTNDGIAYNFLKGGDISELPRLEYYGAKFYDSGIEKDCLQIMKDRGCNFARIRMYNDPGNTNFYPANQLDPLGWQNPARTLALCQRAKAMGMQIQLSFHYSDYWSNPGTQYKPHDWEGLSFSALSNTLYSYTRSYMIQLRNADIVPEFVSLGNEIRGGILFPDGANTNTAGWNNLANLLKGGIAAVKSISPTTKIMIHIDKVDASNVNWFFGNLQSRAVPYDIVGCSYYPFWTDLTTEQARAEIDSFYGNFNKPVMIMETGYRWRATTCNGSGGQLSDNGPEFFPSTQQGHKNFMLKMFNDLKLVNSGNCIGILYWDPIFICVPGQGWQNGQPNVVANTTLFDFTGNALPSFDAYFYNN